MANGIGNKKIGKPADQKENTVVCVSRLAKTERGLDGAGIQVRGLKEQLKKGYFAIKLSSTPVQQVKRNDNEMTI